MGSYADIDSVCDGVITNLRQLADHTLKRLNEETAKAMEDASREFGEYQQKRIREIFEEAVEEFYSAYSPAGYARTKGMLNMLDLHQDADGTIAMTDPRSLIDESKMTKDRKGGDSLFEIVFMQGWHGGSTGINATAAETWGQHPSPGTPYYRRGGIVKRPGSSRGFYHKYGKWGRVAVRTTAPMVLFENSLIASKSSEMFPKFKEISQRHNDAAVARVQDELAELYREIYG